MNKVPSLEQNIVKCRPPKECFAKTFCLRYIVASSENQSYQNFEKDYPKCFISFRDGEQAEELIKKEGIR